MGRADRVVELTLGVAQPPLRLAPRRRLLALLELRCPRAPLLALAFFVVGAGVGESTQTWIANHMSTYHMSTNRSKVFQRRKGGKSPKG